MTTWEPNEDQANTWYGMFIARGDLAGLTKAKALEMIQRRAKVRLSHAYNILNFMFRKGWIVETPGKLAIPMESKK